jgi:hypothetical protein
MSVLTSTSNGGIANSLNGNTSLSKIEMLRGSVLANREISADNAIPLGSVPIIANKKNKKRVKLRPLIPPSIPQLIT